MSWRDPFIPCRVSALGAMAVTVEYFTASEIAQQLVPLAGAHVIDPARDVRVAAIKTTRLLLDKLEHHAEGMTDCVEEQRKLQEQGVDIVGRYL